MNLGNFPFAWAARNLRKTRSAYDTESVFVGAKSIPVLRGLPGIGVALQLQASRPSDPGFPQKREESTFLDIAQHKAAILLVGVLPR